MTSSVPRTTREALIAEILGDLDTLLTRIETLPVLIADAEEKVSGTVRVLEEAGDKYRLAVTAFNEQAKTDLSEYFDLKTAQITSKTIDEFKAVLQEAALIAFHSEAAEKSLKLDLALKETAREFHRSIWFRIMEHAITALIASSFTAGIVYAIFKTHS
jgi:hypothetical protein